MNDTNANLFDSIPEGLSRTVVNYCDAVEQLLGAVRYHYARMLQTAVTDSVQDQLKMLTIVAEVTAFVVTLDRLRRTMNKFPAGKLPLRAEKRIYAQAVRDVEPVRHRFEHVDTEVFTSSVAEQGAFGTISYWHLLGQDEDSQYLEWSAMIPGHGAVGQQAVTHSGMAMRADIDHLSVQIGDSLFDLSDAYYATVRLGDALHDWAKQQAEQGWPALTSWHPGST
jgi:hypothetical protein